MNELAKYKSENIRAFLDKTLEDVLQSLTVVGRPSLFSMRGAKWHCLCETYVSELGTSVDVRSNWDCETPTAAARQCAERVISTINKQSNP
jgi:hypothetical protein